MNVATFKFCFCLNNVFPNFKFDFFQHFRIARFNRYARIYNSWRKTEKNSDLGIYEYNEERSGPFISYAEFRKECKSKKSYNVSAADVLSQLSKSKTKEKLVSNFAAKKSHFLAKNSGQPTDSRITACSADQCAEKQTATISKNLECNLLKKPMLPKESSFKIFKSKYRPRLDVQVKAKHSDSVSLAHQTAGNKRVPHGSFLKAPDFPELCSLPTSSKRKHEMVLINRTNIENSNTSSGSLLKIPNSLKPCILSTSTKNENETVLTSRMHSEDCPKSKEIPLEADVTGEETAVGQNLNDNESTLINLNKFSGEESNQLCSEESVSVIQPTPVDENICTSNSSEPEVVYSSNPSENDVASIECNNRHTVLPNVPHHQLVSFDEERTSGEFFGQPNEANFTLSPVCEKLCQSLSSNEHLSSEPSKETSDVTVIGNFDQLYKLTPLKIESKKNLTSLKKDKHSENCSTFDRLCEDYENNHSGLEVWQTDGEEEKNKVSDSESSIVSSKASPSLVYSVIYTQKSSESESEEINETNFSAVPSPTVVQRDESIDYFPGKPPSDIVYMSQEKPFSQSRNSTPKQHVSKIVFANKEKPLSLLKSSTLEHSVSEIILTSPEKLRSQPRNSTPEQPVSQIMSTSKGMPHSQSKRPTHDQSVSKVVPVSQENPRPQLKNSTSEQPTSKIVSETRRNFSSQSYNSTPEKPVSKIVSATNEHSHSLSKNSSPEQPILEIVSASQEKSRSQLKKPTRKKTFSINLSEVSKVSKARTNEKQVKKLTNFVAFSVRKRHASNFELSESDDQTVSLVKNKSPIPFESTPSSTSIWSPKSLSAGRRTIRKVKKLFNESEDYLSPSPVKETPPIEVNSPDSITGKSPSPSKNTDRSEMEKSSDYDLSPKLHSTAYYQSREVKKLLIESEDSLLRSPTKEKPSRVDFDRDMCESLSFSKQTGCPEIEKSSDSDSSSIILSRDFKTLSLASKKSSILFPSQSPKMSPSGTRSVNIQNSQPSTVLNSQFSTEITLDQVDQMMEGIIPNESADSSFRFDLPSQYTFKESPKSENYDDNFDVSNFSDISASSSSALEKTLVAEEFPDKYSVSSSEEETVPHRHSSNFASQDTTYPASRSTFNENVSSSLYSLEIASKEDIKDEFSDGKVSDPSFSIRERSITKKKSKGFLSSNSNDGLPTRRHCLSLPIESKLAGPKNELRKRQVDVVDIDNTSDEDVFRDSSFKSLPTQLKKKSTSLSAQQLRRKYFQNKENQIGKKKIQQNLKKVVRDSQKSPLSVTAKLRQFSNREKKKSPISSQKSSQFVVMSDDDYESDELNTALNDSLTQFNKRKENKSKWS